LPGLDAARRSRLVICNGGSPTSQQALAAGVPIIGLATNLDQFLNMAAIESAGAGVVLRADRFSANMLRAHVRRLLGGESAGCCPPARHVDSRLPLRTELSADSSRRRSRLGNQEETQ
jgi:hypothetical protein